MGHYALLNNEKIVTQVITGGGDSDDISFETLYGEFHKCITKRTSYNTRGGIHYQSDNNTPSIDQSKSFRKNYAGIGYTYDEQRDAFIPPQPYPSWLLDEFSCLWNAPIPYPNDGNMYTWNEDILNWE